MIKEIDNFINGQCVQVGIEMDIDLKKLDKKEVPVKVITNHIHNIVSRYEMTCGVTDDGLTMYINTPGVVDHKGNQIKIWTNKHNS